MTEKLEEMWAELAKHQPIADKLGYGTQWQSMCELKTEAAAEAAAKVKSLKWPLWGAAWGAVFAIEYGVVSSERGDRAAAYAIRCMRRYNKGGDHVS